MSQFTAESVGFVLETKPKPIDNPDVSSPIFIEQNHRQTVNQVTLKSECDYSSYLQPHIVLSDIKTEEIKLEDDIQFVSGADLDIPMCNEVYEGSCNPSGSKILSICEQENGDLLQAAKVDVCSSNSASEETRQPTNYPKTQETRMNVTLICSHCQCICSTQRELETHTWLRHRKQIPDLKSKLNMNWFFPCDICDYMAVRTFELEKHKMTHHSNLLDSIKCDFKTPNKRFVNKIRCGYCNEEFPYKSNVAHHLLNYHKDLPNLKGLKKIFDLSVECCTSCDYRTVTAAKLRCHFRAKHDELPKFQCYNCNFETDRKSDLRKHMEKHILKEFKCEFCGSIFKKEKLLGTHLLRVHNDSTRAFSCLECDFKTVYFDILQKHKARRHKPTTVTTRSEGENYKCKHCEFITDDQKTLLTHYLKIHGKYYGRVCELCGNVFRRNIHFANHLFRTHKCDKGKKLFESCNFTLRTCEICTDFQTVCLDKYTEHMCKFHETETSETKLHCGNCDYSTTSNANLKKHIDHRHSNDYRFKCSYSNDSSFKLKNVSVRRIFKQYKDRV